MKLCYKCKKDLPPADFCGGKNLNLCKPCFKEYRHKHYLKNKDRYNKACKERHLERMKNDPDYKISRNGNNKQWRAGNPDYFNQYYHDNKDKCKAIRKKYLSKPEAKALRAAHTRSRQARKRNAQPSWANTKYIALFYKLAKIEEARIGEPVHVDHIFPLQHELVCGLHCEFNLQLSTAIHNLQKSNTFQP